MLSNFSLSKYFWVKTLVYACYLVNSLSSIAIEDKTPMEAD